MDQHQRRRRRGSDSDADGSVQPVGVAQLPSPKAVTPLTAAADATQTAPQKAIAPVGDHAGPPPQSIRAPLRPTGVGRVGEGRRHNTTNATAD